MGSLKNDASKGDPLAVRPVGRAHLAEVLAKIAREVNRVQFEFRWQSALVESSDGLAREQFRDSIEALESASESMLEFAIGVKLGTHGVKSLPIPQPAAPLLDLIEQGSGGAKVELNPKLADAMKVIDDYVSDFEEKADKIIADTDRFVSAPKTFEVLDRGPDHPGHIQFDAAGQAEAEAIQLGLEYDPQPPFQAGSPEAAAPEVVAAVKRRMAASRGQREALIPAPNSST